MNSDIDMIAPVEENPIWKHLINTIRSELPREEFLMWFQEINYIETRNNTILLEVPSTFYKDQIKQRYLPKILEILQKYEDGIINVEFSIKNKTSQKTTQTKRSTSSKEEETAKIQSSGSVLNPEYTFENFVIGDNNRFAANAAHAISKNPGTAYNPCLIYGGVGLGKTHLLQSIGNSTLENFEKIKVTYVTAEDFTNSFIRSIQENKTYKFKNEYRHTDILLIDDIHFLQKKHETQEELFHTFNTLFNTKKQMVFTSDRPISEIKDITERLQNRFTRGLTVDLQPPEIETAIAILQKKISKTNTYVPDEVIAYICQQVTTNIRDLEAALTQIIAYSELINKDITLEVTQQRLNTSFLSRKQENITINAIQLGVSNYFNISSSDIKGKKRSRSITFPRHIAMYIAREITENSLTDIGLEFGGRDHTTVMHACHRIETMIRSDITLSDSVNIIIRKIKENIQ